MKPIVREGYDSEWGFYRNKHFYIRSRLPMKRIIQVCPGNKTCIRRRVDPTKRNGQIWYFDPVGKVIKDIAWKYVIEIRGSGTQNHLALNSKMTSMWW